MKKSILHSHSYLSLVLLTFLALVSTEVSATRYYVDLSATGSNTGSSWTNAYTSLQSAIASAASGDEVWVATGIYYPSAYPSGASGSSARDYSFYLAGGVQMYGGFAGTETTLAARDYATNMTILSGDIGTANDITDNCYHVVMSVNESTPCTLDGFTVTRGNGNVSNYLTVNSFTTFSQYGGGMYSRNSSLSITNTTFSYNTASDGGGGMYNYSTSSITNCTFSNNTAATFGGGMYNEYSATITNCTFSDNTADFGGGIMNSHFPTFTNTTFSNNTANYGGGAIDIYSGSPTITNCIFWGNMQGSSSTAAGSDIKGGTPIITYTTLQVSHTGTGNSTADPLFVDASDPAGADGIHRTADDGLRLYYTSPAANTGNNSAIPSGITTDIIGSARTQNTTVNRGAYEDLEYSIRFVNSSATGTNDGLSWANAYTSLESALALAASGDTIWVAAGTYYPSAYPSGASGSSARDYSFYLAGGVHLYGGFAGTETTLAARDYATNVTILSGDIGTVDNSTDNCHHVVTSVNESTAGTLDGFTVTRGNANGSGTLTANTKAISRNHGGGMHNVSSSPTITNCTFSENTSGYGGGMYNYLYASPTITNCTFSENTSGYGGGMFNNGFCSPTITNSIFSDNSASTECGGMYNHWSSNPTITNSTFSNNTAATDGGGMHNSQSSSPTITNSIFWGNIQGSSSTATGSDIKNSSSTPTITYTTLQVSYTGTGNSTADPLFVDASNPAGADGIHRTADDGLRLFSNSPAANTGNNNSIPSGITTDIIGSARIQNTTVNRGAYEDLGNSIRFVNSSATGTNDGLSWANAYTSLESALASVASGDTIWVATGTYYPSAYPSGASGSSARDYSFYLAGGVHLYGGFAGTETTLAARDYATNVTILSGDIGTVDNSTDNCHHVVTIVNESTAGTLDGFTVTRGNANGSGTLTVNTKAIYRTYGGGMMNQSSSPTITNTTFSDNTATYGGGMMNYDYSSPTITNTSFIENTGGAGGGIYNVFSSSPAITNCTFIENTATSSGGGVTNQSSSPTITNTSFIENTATYGGGVTNQSSSPTITNTSFIENTATYGGGMHNQSSLPTITNSIFWGNIQGSSSTAAGSDIKNSSSTPTITYTTLQVSYTGTGNSTADPLFVDASNPAGADGIHRTADDGLRLYSNSPAANTGNNNSIPSGITTDIIGSPRIQCTTVNMGAYENTAPKAVTNNITVYLDASGAASITTSDIDNSPSDNCSIITLVLDITSFDCNDLGTNTVTLTATDANSNSSSATAVVTVVDNISPTVLTNNITVYLDASGAASITTSDIDNGSSDNCSITLSLDITSFDCNDVGTNTVTLTATDANSNSSSATAIVTVVDNISPTVLTNNVTVYLDASGAASITTSDIDNGSSDNCSITTFTLTNTSFDCNDLGTNTVTLIASDPNGNIDFATAVVTVVDNISPTVVTNNVTVYLDASGAASITTADIDNSSSDNCSITLSLDITSFDCSDVGTNTVTLTATDVNSNSSSATAVVTVVDNISPTVLTNNITVYLDASGAASITTADIDNGSSDNCSITTLVLDITSFDCNDVGTNTVSLTATDANSNSSSATAVVTVVDNISPTVLTNNVTVYLDASGAASITTADIDNSSSDNCSITLSLDITSFDCSDLGTNTVTLTATDANSNSSSATAVVTVVDNISPTVLTNNVTVYLDASGAASITTADIDNSSSDNCSITTLVLDITSFDCDDVGTNTVSLTATDANSNSSSATAVVTVVDNISPTVLTNNITVYLDASGAASITTADIDNGSSDNCSITTFTLTNTSFDCNDIGTNTVTLIASDPNGNIGFATALVTVVDTISPVILTAPNNITLGYCDARYTYSTPTASDNCSFTVTQTAGLPSGSKFPTGTTTNIFVVTDASGNEGVTSFDITIIEEHLPFTLNDLSYCGNYTQVDLSQERDDITFTGQGVGSNSISFEPVVAGVGTHIITAAFTDSMGCVTKGTFNITVLEAPIVPLIERVASDKIQVVEDYSSYLWYHNGVPIEGDKSKLYRVMELGLYSVLVGNENNCYEISNGYEFGIPFLEEEVIQQNLVTVYPNPTENVLFIEFESGDDTHMVTITNGLGVELIKANTDKQVYRLDISHLAAGPYYVNVVSSTINETVKIIKK
jgi:predicted outer membrane repeat protein